MTLTKIVITNGTDQPMTVSTPDGSRPWVVIPPRGRVVDPEALASILCGLWSYESKGEDA